MKSRRWFVVLAWVTMVGFAIFVAAVTAVAVSLPKLQKTHVRSGR